MPASQKARGELRARGGSIAARTATDWARVAGVRITSADKHLFPEIGWTKVDLARLVEALSEYALPHVAGRPLMLLRCPDGPSATCFVQKRPMPGMPRDVEPVEIREKTNALEAILVRNVAGLVSLVQMGALEFHVWGARIDDLERPDLLVFDLDPGPGVPWAAIAAAALEVRERLATMGLTSFCKTTGGEGLHVCAPLTGRDGWERVGAFARSIAGAMTTDAPARYLDPASGRERPGRTYVDVTRNARGATMIAPYSTRARGGAPIATPLTWPEVARIRPEEWSARTVPERLRHRLDPWRGFFDVRQALP